MRYAVANGPNSPSPADHHADRSKSPSTSRPSCTDYHADNTTGNVTSSWMTDANITDAQDAKVVITYNYPSRFPSCPR